MHRNPIFLPVLAAIIGIGFFSGMDAIMKSASIAIGAYSAFFLRSVIGFAMIFPYWLVRERNWPQRAVPKDIGRASCTDRVCQYVYVSAVHGSLNNTVT